MSTALLPGFWHRALRQRSFVIGALLTALLTLFLLLRKKKQTV